MDQVLWRQFPPDRKKRFHLLRRHGLGEIIALHNVAAQVLQGHQLFLGLHPLGDHRHREMVRKVDDDLQHPGVPLLFERAAHKLHIQLQRVNRQRGNHIQRGIPGAEVIHLDLEAHVLELCHSLDDLLRILCVGRLRDFQKQFAGLEPVILQNA